MDKKIIFLLSHVPNPRINKRIAVAVDCGNVSIICTRRKSQNIWEPAYVGIEHIVLEIDLPSSNHLVKRFFVSRQYQKDAYNHLASLKPDLIYAEGLDSLIIANKYKATHQNTHIFFETADLRECFIEKPKSLPAKITTKLISKVEKKNFKQVECLVLTSMRFYESHYYELIDEDRVVYMPNVPDLVSFARYAKKKCGIFTVGFIGGLRYPNQMKMLVDATEAIGCNALFAGASFLNDDYRQITQYCKDKNFVTFTGKYDYNRDIARLYGMVDCVYAVYDATNANVKIALPNKLFEAVFCELPIIVAKGTYLAELVQQWGVGIAIDSNSLEDLCSALLKLSTDHEYYSNIVAACRIQKQDTAFHTSNKELFSGFCRVMEKQI